MPYDETMRKVRYDLQRDLIEKARQRLTGMLNHLAYPNSLEIRRLLGDINFQQGNIIEAGRYWYLEEHKSPEMQDACERFEKACGYRAFRILRRLDLKRIETLRRTFPHLATVLEQLVIRASLDYTTKYGHSWLNYFWKFGLLNRYPLSGSLDRHYLFVDTNGVLSEVAQAARNIHINRPGYPLAEPNFVTYITSSSQKPVEQDDYVHTYVANVNELDARKGAIHEAVIKRGRFFTAFVWLPIETDVKIHEFLSQFVNFQYSMIFPITITNSEYLDTNKLRNTQLFRYCRTYFSEYIIGYAHNNGDKRWLTLSEIQTKLMDRILLYGIPENHLGTVDTRLSRPEDPIPAYYFG